jgi:hypothetical protein
VKKMLNRFGKIIYDDRRRVNIDSASVQAKEFIQESALRAQAQKAKTVRN